MAHDVFISYSSSEYDKASLVRTVLKNNGISTWMAPESIPGGGNYMEVIPDAIANSKVFLLILSNSSQKSKWVPKEVEQALNNNIVIIPFLIENCKINSVFSFIIGNSQRINAFQQMQTALEELVRLVHATVNVKNNSNENSNIDTNENSKINSNNGTNLNDAKINLNYNVKPVQSSFVTENGDFYEGFLLNDKPHGKGKMEYSNGDVYEGFWKNGQKCGKGIIVYSNGDKYEGEWNNDLPNGTGVQTYASGSTYTGKIVDGKREGKGKYSYSNGDCYDGDWKDDNRNGKGKYTYKNGDYYDGDWVDNKETGFGKQKYSISGNLEPYCEYEGNFKNDKHEGEGKLKYRILHKFMSDGVEKSYHTDAYVYEGNFTNGKFNGNGNIEYSSDGQKYFGKNFYTYKGEWKDGSINGKGRMSYSYDRIDKEEKPGNYIEGYFTDGKVNGYAEEFAYDGYTEIELYKKGEWKNGKIVTGKVKLQWEFLYDICFEAELKDGKFIGEMKPTIEGEEVTYEYDEYINDKITITVKFDNWRGTIKFIGKMEGCYFKDDSYKMIFDNMTLEGEWDENTVEVKYNNGDTYKGVWNFVSHCPGDLDWGYGEEYKHDGSYYKGQWDVEGYKVGKGYGKIIYEGGYYEGELYNYREEGKGKYVWNDGDIYDGDWKDGYREGIGKYIWPNGDYYEGGFKNSKRHGKGKYYYASTKKIEEGEWYEGKKIS